MYVRIARGLFIAALLLSTACGGASPKELKVSSTPTGESQKGGGPKVDVIVFMMARCPHCADLLSSLLPLAKRMGDDLRLSFGWVGALGEDGEPEMGYSKEEMTAAAAEICAGIHAENEKFLDFLECLYSGDRWESLPGSWPDCAAGAGVDPDAVRKCIDDGEGEDQLIQAISMSTKEGIRGAPTVFVQGHRYLGEISEGALLSRLCGAMAKEGISREVCAGVELPPAVSATLLTDVRCEEEPECDVAREVAFLHSLLPAMEVSELDYSTEDGKKLYRRMVSEGGGADIPMLILGPALSEYPVEKAMLDEYLRDLGKRGYLMPLGRGWDPTAEICSNGIDDDEDGETDCDDEECAGVMDCREKIPGRLDLFVMSRCPFAMSLIPEVVRFLDHMGANGSSVDFSLRFIGEVVDGELDSMHGRLEVEEDLRMICAQELYPENREYMKYVACRAEDYIDQDWRRCLTDRMDEKKLGRCATGATGRTLLEESFRLSEVTEMNASPSWMIDNNREVDGRDAQAILEMYCESNESAACQVEIPASDESAKPLTDRCE